MTQQEIEKLSNKELAAKIGEIQSATNTATAMAICMSDTSSFDEHAADQARHFSRAADNKKLLDRLIAEGTKRIEAKRNQTNQ